MIQHYNTIKYITNKQRSKEREIGKGRGVSVVGESEGIVGGQRECVVGMRTKR